MEQLPITSQTIDAARCAIAAQEWAEAHPRWGRPEVERHSGTVTWAWAHTRYGEQMNPGQGSAVTVMIQHAREAAMTPGVRITSSAEVLVAVAALGDEFDELVTDLEAEWPAIQARAWWMEAHRYDD
ncbi:hypothetical protein [Mycobacteroides chelonae]|uniref:hypothetical protein n=1 Tax=Mycobacteroides chelonae TaxID=1774 RepID=UPI0018B0899F|nr:hypothetical protein [Mycobacteroides chelonae]MBF9519514.1 hypothetical protein [Mycobacteroides chelonae]